MAYRFVNVTASENEEILKKIYKILNEEDLRVEDKLIKIKRPP